MPKKPPASADESDWMGESYGSGEVDWSSTEKSLERMESEMSVMTSEVSQLSLPHRLKQGNESTAHALQKALAATYAYRARATAIIVDAARIRAKAGLEASAIEADLFKRSPEYRRLKTQSEKALAVCMLSIGCHRVRVQSDSTIESARQIIKLCDGVVATAEAMTRAHYAVRDKEQT